MNVNEKLKSLRMIMSRHNIDAYIVPTCDFHGSEYIGEHFKCREFISGFTGSAGTAVITLDEARLWTDGRYFLQAEQQLGESEFVLMKSGQPKVPAIAEYLKKTLKNGSVIGFDGRTMMALEAEQYVSIPKLIIKSDVDLIGEIWTERPEISFKPVWKLPEKYSGMSRNHKLKNIRKEMQKEKRDVLLIGALDEIAWTLNLRGDDVKCNFVFMAFMIVTSKTCCLFVEKNAFSKELCLELERDNVGLYDYDTIYSYISNLDNKRIWIDKNTTNFNILNHINPTNIVTNKFTPPLIMKSVKNFVEIKNMKKAHLLDGIAMTKFIYWLKKNVGQEQMSEVSLGRKLEEFRKTAESYLGPSFEPIVGYKEHGAIVHYSATPQTDYPIKNEGIVLIDSGGQYMEGTTDVTRTISLGSVTEKMREMYTAVLRGNLNLAAAVFKEGCSGVSLDYMARKPLWDKGFDYNHGTGHGVGYLLNVHEMPNAFRYKIMQNAQLNPAFKPGMITSDEPGVYLPGEFGIRIENLILCIKKKANQYGTFLGFKPLTLIPFDRNLINKDEMTIEEQNLLLQYNRFVYRKISPYLEKEEKEWLKKEIK